ncbi:hypothetical protein QTP88_011761 [Uroleucon formosanum]
MYASPQLTEQWAQRWNGEMSPDLFTESEVRLISPPRYSSMFPMHDKDDFLQARAADEDRGIKELLTQATWAPTKTLLAMCWAGNIQNNGMDHVPSNGSVNDIEEFPALHDENEGPATYTSYSDYYWYRAT